MRRRDRPHRPCGSATRRAGPLQTRCLDCSSPSGVSGLAEECRGYGVISQGEVGRHGQPSKSRVLVCQFLLHPLLAARTLAERACVQKFPAGSLHIGALALEIVVDRPAETGIGDVVRRICGARQVAARELVLALGASFDTGESVSDRIFDGLVIADLEMQERMMLD